MNSSSQKYRTHPRTPKSNPLNSPRSPRSSVAPAPVVASLRSASSSWTTPPVPLSATLRAPSARTTSCACSSLSARPVACVENTDIGHRKPPPVVSLCSFFFGPLSRSDTL
ncbi:hypothetical protein BC938DRAFT_471992 [Jimgerdemannia flammicorona]|uniref:Uncharacterized protein n=1 Tax=Jimgerdemannia flammicorona TaxID=994334 RepID=A0A433Q6Y7_9FUNG|nr:hypothetical protein BC938DRAFT_471992 [Jimgerdemannia flammicorona]